jgi:hypothetical protein
MACTHDLQEGVESADEAALPVLAGHSRSGRPPGGGPTGFQR